MVLGGGTTLVQQGETLQDIAERIYGSQASALGLLSSANGGITTPITGTAINTPAAGLAAQMEGGLSSPEGTAGAVTAGAMLGAGAGAALTPSEGLMGQFEPGVLQPIPTEPQQVGGAFNPLSSFHMGVRPPLDPGRYQSGHMGSPLFMPGVDQSQLVDTDAIEAATTPAPPPAQPAAEPGLPQMPTEDSGVAGLSNNMLQQAEFIFLEGLSDIIMNYGGIPPVGPTGEGLYIPDNIFTNSGLGAGLTDEDMLAMGWELGPDGNWRYAGPTGTDPPDDPGGGYPTGYGYGYNRGGYQQPTKQYYKSLVNWRGNTFG